MVRTKYILLEDTEKYWWYYYVEYSQHRADNIMHENTVLRVFSAVEKGAFSISLIDVNALTLNGKRDFAEKSLRGRKKYLFFGR